jgi:SAM-dependent methyltransferase
MHVVGPERAKARRPASRRADCGGVTDTYGNVDGSADVRAALAWQERIDAWPHIRAYKQDTYARAASLRPVLDVGCGTGHDLNLLGLRSIGVDHSDAMVRHAHERGCTVTQAEAVRLPFADGAFGAARADRVLQHLVDPIATLREMVRVTRASGRVIVADPDQESLVMHVPGVRLELVERAKQLRRDRGYRNGRLARAMPEAFEAAGLRDVIVDAHPLVLTDPDDAFGLPGWVTYWREQGEPFTASEGREWDAGIERARAGGFLYALLYLVTSGTVA